MYVYVCVWVRVFLCLLVFFSWGKVELHGFVHLPVLFADQLQREGTIQNLWTEFRVEIYSRFPTEPDDSLYLQAELFFLMV